jgi:hypothetical protein
MVSLGLPCAVWLVATVEVALRNTRIKDFVKSFWEVQQVLIFRRGENKAGRFLELVVYAEGDRQGLILLLEGCDRRGWARFAGDLARWWLLLKPRLLPLFVFFLFCLS